MYFFFRLLFLYLDTSSFGRKMMEKMGWKTGQGLGLNNDGSVSHIKISVKEDNLGIGASRKDSEGGWLNNSKSYQEVLDRLAASAENSLDKKNKITMDDRKISKKKKKNKSRKDKDKDLEKDNSELDKKMTDKDNKILKSRTNPTVLKQAHRAKYIRNKAVSTYSEASLKEILGEINS